MLGRRRWWVPIQFGYASNPWWKFEHLRRVNRVLMPTWRRLYPVGAEVRPPADVDALVGWMQRWKLMPAGVAAGSARARLEALAASPVQTVATEPPSPGRAPDRAASDEIVRLPAEWEASEAVLVTWPILYPGLWPFHRQLVTALAAVARVEVLIPHAIYAAAVLAHLGDEWAAHPRLRFLVAPSDDIWVRDYGPLTCVGSSGRRTMIDAIFDPPPAMPFVNDDAFPVRYAAHRQLASRHLPLHLEGGNLWSDGQGTIISTEGLFHRNPALHRDEVTRRLLEGLGATKLIVVPPLRREDTGHVDVFLKLANANTVLITEPRSRVNRRTLIDAASTLARTCSAAGEPYRVVELPSVPFYRNWGIVRVWPSYANALTVNGRVLVPTYGDGAPDAAALAIYRRVMPDHEIVGIDASVAANAGGTVHCLTMQVPAEGVES